MHIHPAYWMLKQLHAVLSEPSWFINIRAIVNLAPFIDNTGATQKGGTRVVFNENIKIESFKQTWESGLLNKLTALNNATSDPANIYFGVNPRKSNLANKKDDIAGYIALYLDCDDNANFDKEHRLQQINFWRDIGFSVSFLVDSGHGYHPYWLLNKLADNSNQEILKKMVAFTGCKDKGNTHDPTRILRLPGFKNVKNWFQQEQDMPICSLVLPNNYQDIELLTQRYDIETFNWYFPPSLQQDIEHYHQKAVELGEDKPLEQRIQQLALQAAQARRQAILVNSGIDLANQITDRTAQLGISEPLIPGQTTETIKPEYTPTRKLVPPIDELAFPKGKKYLKKYCVKGAAGLTENEKTLIAQALERDVSPSELDMMIISWLVHEGYMFEAVVEFWQRPTLKLWRKKIEENKNYLQLSYDKALQLERQKRKELDTTQKVNEYSEPKVIVQQSNTYFLKAGQVEKILSGQLDITTRYIDSDSTSTAAAEKEWFELKVSTLTKKGERSRQSIVSRKAFSSLQDFKEKICGDSLCVFARDNSTLQHLLHHLEKTTENPPRLFRSKLGYHEDTFILPKVIVTKDTVIDRDEQALFEFFAQKDVGYTWFTDEYLTEEDTAKLLNTEWLSLLQCHLPRLVASTLGIIGSATIGSIFRAKLKISDFHFPTLNLRGSSSSGKTETIKHIFKLTGVKPENSIFSTESSLFSIQRALSLFDFVPFIIDEFKSSDGNFNQKRLAEIRGLVRRIYSGEGWMRGQANLGITIMYLHNPLIIIGEESLERIGAVSEVSRILPIATDEFRTDINVAQWDKISQVKWQEISVWLYKYVLGLNITEEHQKFKDTKQKVTQEIHDAFAGEKSRIAHNIAIIKYGCSIIDRFVHKYAPKLPKLEEILNTDKNITHYFKEWARENRHSLITEEKGQKTVYANDEFFNLISIYSEIITMKDKLLMEYTAVPHKEDEASDTLSIWLPNMHKMVREYLQRQNKLVVDFEKIKSIIKGHTIKETPWLISASKTRRLNEATTAKCLILKLSEMRKLGVWHKPLNEEQQEIGTEPIDKKVAIEEEKKH